MTNPPIHLRLRTHNRRQIRRHPGPSQPPVHHAQPILIHPPVRLWDGEIKPLRAVQLHIQQTGGQDAAAQIDDLIGAEVQLVEGDLVAEDFAGARVDPEVLFKEVSVVGSEEAAVGEFGDAGGCGSFAGHFLH